MAKTAAKAKVKRVRFKVVETEGGVPALAEVSEPHPTPSETNLAQVTCISTGCSLLDCTIGGGWARGRVANIVGDKSVGKSLLAIEACANFHATEPRGKIYYRESEAAFDIPYAEVLGLPAEAVDFGPDGIDSAWDTVEDIFEDLDRVLTECKSAGVPGLYIVDSLDALSSRAELSRKPGEATFGLEKQKLLGKLFRQLIRRLKTQDFCVIIVSQVRDKIGVVFGDKHTRTGGKALDFYASQIVWLSHLGIINQTIKGVRRATGVRIKAKCKKNKIGKPFRECEMVLDFGYGIDDVTSGLEWLDSVKATERLGTSKEVDAMFKLALTASGEELSALRDKVRTAVVAEWEVVEGRFAPKRRKYS